MGWNRDLIQNGTLGQGDIRARVEGLKVCREAAWVPAVLVREAAWVPAVQGREVAWGRAVQAGGSAGGM